MRSDLGKVRHRSRGGGRLLRGNARQIRVDLSFFRSTYDAVKTNGLWLVHHAEGGRREPVDSFEVHSSVESIDLRLGDCATKTTTNPSLCKSIRPLIGEGTSLLTLQNAWAMWKTSPMDSAPTKPSWPACFTCINRTAPSVVESLLPGMRSVWEFGRPVSEKGMGIARPSNQPGADSGGGTGRTLWRKLLGDPFNGLAIAGGAHH